MKYKNIFVILALTLVAMGSSCSSKDGDKLAKGLKQIFLKVSQHTDSVYLADSILTTLNFSMSDLQQQFSDKDSLLLRSMIDSGEKEMLDPTEIQRMLAPFRVRVISTGQFDSIVMPPPNLTSDEMQ